MKGLINSENWCVPVSVWLRIAGRGYESKGTVRTRGGSPGNGCLKSRCWRCTETNDDWCLDICTLTCHWLLVSIILAAKEVSQSCSGHIWVYYYQYLDWYTGNYSKCSPGWMLQRKVSSKKGFMGDLWVFPANLGEKGDFGCKPMVMRLLFCCSKMQLPTSHASAP